MLKEFSEFFKRVNNQVIFTGDRLEVRIPRRYENYDMLVIADDVKTLAIFELIINDELRTGCMLPAIINMEPSDTYLSTVDGQDVAVLVFTKGDVFMSNTAVIRNPNIAYVMFVEFVSLGNMPKFLDYNDTAFIFDKASEICGVNFPVNHAVFEMIYAHLCRNPRQVTQYYRHTDMSEPHEFIRLRSVSYGPDSTTARMLGSYFNDAVDASLVHPSENRSELEDLLRS